MALRCRRAVGSNDNYFIAVVAGAVEPVVEDVALWSTRSVVPMATSVAACGNRPQLDQPFNSSQPGEKNSPKSERMAAKTPLI